MSSDPIIRMDSVQISSTPRHSGTVEEIEEDTSTSPSDNATRRIPPISVPRQAPRDILQAYSEGALFANTGRGTQINNIINHFPDPDDVASQTQWISSAVAFRDTQLSDDPVHGGSITISTISTRKKRMVATARRQEIVGLRTSPRSTTPSV